MSVIELLRAEIVRLAQKVPRCPYEAQNQATTMAACISAISALQDEARVDHEIRDFINGTLAFAWGFPPPQDIVDRELAHFWGKKP